jgi:hypothetical protein
VTGPSRLQNRSAHEPDLNRKTGSEPDKTGGSGVFAVWLFFFFPFSNNFVFLHLRFRANNCVFTFLQIELRFELLHKKQKIAKTKQIEFSHSTKR